MRLPPLSVLLSWPVPNYIDPVTHGSALLIVNIVFIVLVVIAVTGRFYARLVVQRWYGWDDSMIALAALFTIGMTTDVVLGNASYGWDLHEWDLSAALIPGANKVAFAAKLLFTLAATCTRISLICFYFRLVKDSGIEWFRYVLIASLVWNVAVCITFVCEVIWLCVPIQAYWQYPPDLNATCLNEGTVLLAGGVINCFSDLLTAVLPIPIVMRLQMPIRQRFGVCVLLCLGFIVTLAGIVRTYFIWKSLIATWDETWFAYPLWISAVVEIDLAVICACAPAWKSLLRRPVNRLSMALSSKISSARSRSKSTDSPNASRNGGLTFNPVRSLPWFQVTRLDFEKGNALASVTPKNEISRSDSAAAIELGIVDHGLDASSYPPTIHAGHPHPAEDMMPARPQTPSLMIYRQQSLEQESAYVGDANFLAPPSPAASPRRSISPRRSMASLLTGRRTDDGAKESGTEQLLPREDGR